MSESRKQRSNRSQTDKGSRLIQYLDLDLLQDHGSIKRLIKLRSIQSSHNTMVGPYVVTYSMCQMFQRSSLIFSAAILLIFTQFFQKQLQMFKMLKDLQNALPSNVALMTDL